MHETLSNDPGAIWRNQPVASVINLEQVRESARRFDAKMRRNKILYWASLILLPVMFNVRASMGDSFWWQVIRCGILAAWLFNMEVGYTQLRQKNKLVGLGLNDGLTPCLEYYRKEILHHLDYFRNDALRLVYPIVIIGVVAVPAVIRFVSTPRTVLNLVPFVVLTTVWTVWSIRNKRRELPRIQNELRVLNVFHSARIGQ